MDDITVITEKLNEARQPWAWETELAFRILKISEEAGEAAQAYIGYTGQNPRKGKTHTLEQVIDELFDVALTALVAAKSLDANLNTLYEFNRFVDGRMDRLCRAMESE